MLTRNIELLRQWFREVAGTYDIHIWFNLNESAFTIWKQLSFQSAPTTPDDGLPLKSTSASTTSPPSTMQSEATMFFRCIKWCLSDYNKFKDDSRW
jgi:hypothetical protein